VYFTRNIERIFIIDFNSYSPRTDSLLFSWDEIHRLERQQQPQDQEAARVRPVFRVVSSPTQASQSMPSFSANRYPKEVVSLSDGASIAEFAQRWREALEEATREDVSEKDLKEMERIVAGR
jgi:D123